jgi:hypothetical protein
VDLKSSSIAVIITKFHFRYSATVAKRGKVKEVGIVGVGKKFIFLFFQKYLWQKFRESFHKNFEITSPN